MKRLLTFILLAGAFHLAAQNVSYLYDSAGNRTERTIVFPQQQAPSSSSAAEPALAAPIEDSLAEHTIRIYPNPTKGLLSVEINNLSEEVKGEYLLHNMAGQLIKKEEATPGTTLLDLSGQPPGIYLLLIRLNNETVTWKIIKQ
jgi:hypothetical protein